MIRLALALLLVAAPALSQTDPAATVREANKILNSGDVAGALRMLEAAVQTSPKAYDVRLALGRALDLEGRHDRARAQFEEAIKLANDEQRPNALSALGTSYAFESKPDESARYYQRVFDVRMQADDRAGAANTANALGRIYLESGNLAKAQQWYTTGYETARKIPGLTAPDATLWEMRRHNALGRIEARRGNAAAAAEHAASVKTLLDKGLNENQRPFYPYLLGYIAFFAKDYKLAIEELSKGDQTDPFVLGLIAQAYDRLRQRDRAAEYYRKVMAQPVHSINSAFARPLARKYLR